ncbi:hypothetical protein [Aminobacter sp. BE322]|uniref:hypothetical protein n=1 Tax=unclassified Aminobacter TaxID=2644704 RepID=UPI003D1C2207
MRRRRRAVHRLGGERHEVLLCGLREGRGHRHGRAIAATDRALGDATLGVGLLGEFAGGTIAAERVGNGVVGCRLGGMRLVLVAGRVRESRLPEGEHQEQQRRNEQAQRGPCQHVERGCRHPSISATADGAPDGCAAPVRRWV